MVKNYMKNGKWIERPGKLAIFLCKCGNRYIKTRHNQKMCIPCIAGTKVLVRD